MEQYTLNRFYYEAKALIEKYGLQGLEGYEFQVDFRIKQEADNMPKLQCSVHYTTAYDSPDPSYYGFGPTPALCLSQFEEKLRDKTGKALLEDLSVELLNPEADNTAANA